MKKKAADRITLAYVILFTSALALHILAFALPKVFFAAGINLTRTENLNLNTLYVLFINLIITFIGRILIECNHQIAFLAANIIAQTSLLGVITYKTYKLLMCFNIPSLIAIFIFTMVFLFITKTLVEEF